MLTDIPPLSMLFDWYNVDMAINRQDLEMAKYILNSAVQMRHFNAQNPQAIPVKMNDITLLQTFLIALEEHFDRPGDNVASREWRAQIYSKLLDSPEALQQFTEQALKKFGVENLSMMVAPDIQWKIVENYFEQAPVDDVVNKLRSENKLSDLLEYLMDAEPEFVAEYFDVPDEGYQDQVDAAFDQGKEEGRAEGFQDGFDQGRSEGFEEGQLSARGEFI